jgi:hypothetical protein
MKTRISLMGPMAAAGVLALTLISQQAQANPINGAIAFGGSYSLPAGQNLGDATQLDGISAIVTSDAGDYGTIPVFTTAAVFASPLMISPPTPASPLWTVTSGGNVYTFYATTSKVVSQGPAIGGYELDMQGVGYAEINGIDNTAGTWGVTASQSGIGFGFESSATVSGVPDGCMTLGLFGSALVALQGLRRKLGC